LSEKHLVCLICKNDGNRGTADVICPSNGIDTRDLLSLGELIALVSQAPILISNDSAPIHIAGAFNNWIVLLPSCKHPDHVLPYRNGSPYHKAKALYKLLTIDECDSRPTTMYETSADSINRGWYDYLMPAKNVVNEVEEIWAQLYSQ